jgi:hypothetical protein
MHTEFQSGNLKGRGRLVDLSRWEDIIKMDLKWGLKVELDSGSGYGPITGSCGNSNELSGSKKKGNFLISYVTISCSRKTLLRRI